MRHVAHLCSSAAGELQRHLLVVPVGATEQHGPHLPLDTDTAIACALAERLASAARDMVVVAPAITYGSSGEHQAFPGTLSIGADATRILIVELCRSANYTWPRVLLISTHGGNRDVVNDAVGALRNESRDVRAWSPQWGGDLHAGHTETSLMLALDPGRVGAYDDAVGRTDSLEQLLPTMREHGVAAVSPTGVLGDARWADAAVGQHLLNSAVNELISLVNEWGWT